MLKERIILYILWNLFHSLQNINFVALQIFTHTREKNSLTCVAKTTLHQTKINKFANTTLLWVCHIISQSSDWQICNKNTHSIENGKNKWEKHAKIKRKYSKTRESTLRIWENTAKREKIQQDVLNSKKKKMLKAIHVKSSDFHTRIFQDIWGCENNPYLN